MSSQLGPQKCSRWSRSSVQACPAVSSTGSAGRARRGGGAGGRRLVQVVMMVVQPLDVMVVAPLRLADLGLVTEDRHPVLAQRTVHVPGAVQRFPRPRGQRLQQQRVGLQVRDGHPVEVGAGQRRSSTWA